MCKEVYSKQSRLTSFSGDCEQAIVQAGLSKEGSSIKVAHATHTHTQRDRVSSRYVVLGLPHQPASPVEHLNNLVEMTERQQHQKCLTLKNNTNPPLQWHSIESYTNPPLQWHSIESCHLEKCSLCNTQACCVS